MRLKLILIIALVIIIGEYTQSFAGWLQVWQVKGETAVIRNPAGFTFFIEKDKCKPEACLHIPLVYSLNFSTKKSFIKVQVDKNKVKEVKCHYDQGHSKDAAIFHTYGIIFTPDDVLIQQLKQGSMFKVSFYRTDGWTDFFYFSLKGSNDAITKILGGKKAKIKTRVNDRKTEKKWRVKYTTDVLGSTYKITQIKNSQGFLFNVESGFYTIGTIKIPNNYPRASLSAQFVKFQIDESEIQKKEPDFYNSGKKIDFNLNSDDILKLKNGHVFKFSYLGNNGWVGFIKFSLNGSVQALSEIL